MASAGASGPASYRWTVLAVAVAAQAAFAGVLFGVPAVAPAVRQEYGLTLPELGIALSAVGVGLVLTLYAWGALTDRIGERRVLLAGLAGAAVALGVAAVVEGFAPLVAALVIAGGLGGCTNAATGRALMGWFGAEERGLAFGVRQTALPLGGALSAAALPPLVGAVGLGAGFALLAGLCAAAALLAGLALRVATPTAQAEREARPAPLRDPRIRRLALVSALLTCGQFSILSFLVLFLASERGFSPQTAAAVLVATNVAGALARVAAGRASDRRGRRIALLRAIALSGAAALGVVAALTGAPVAVVVAALLFAGVVTMSWNGLAFLTTAELAGASRTGTAIGFQNSAIAIASASTPAVLSVVIDLGSWPLAWALAAGLQLAGGLLLAPLLAEERAGRKAARAAA